jgi:hypothetical protein
MFGFLVTTLLSIGGLLVAIVSYKPFLQAAPPRTLR